LNLDSIKVIYLALVYIQYLLVETKNDLIAAVYISETVLFQKSTQIIVLNLHLT
jgi:hypothetical protein